jgi:hypothetical protein
MNLVAIRATAVARIATHREELESVFAPEERPGIARRFNAGFGGQKILASRRDA